MSAISIRSMSRLLFYVTDNNSYFALFCSPEDHLFSIHPNFTNSIISFAALHINCIATMQIVYLIIIILIKKASGLTEIQPHRCIVDCAFNVSFDDLLVVPIECRRELISDGCGMAAALNFNSREIRITLSSEMGKLNFDGEQLETGLLHKVELGI